MFIGRYVSQLFFLSLLLVEMSLTTANGGNANYINPFANGCLQVMAERYNDTTHKFEPRVCNSDDIGSGNTVCRTRKLDNYFEVRTAPCDWDEAIMLGWVNQILMSEVLGVPSTIEGGSGLGDPSYSFYDKDSRFKYPPLNYDRAMKTLVEASKVNGDCSQTDKPCAHIMPSVWAGGKIDAKKYQESGGIIQGSSEWNGIHGRIGLYLPIKTARRDPTLDTYLGLQGEKNRQKLAETFKTPTTWKDYCNLPYSNCTHGDTVTSREPTADEEEMYFVEGLYTGHFRTDFTNNCTANENCVGNVIAPICSWTNYIESQMYWNNISLFSQGPVSPNSGYTYGQMLQIYSAANATYSDVIFWWWTPEILLSTFAYSDYSLQRVALPQPTRECTDYRIKGNIDRCHASYEVRRGREGTGACDYEPEVPTKMFSTGFLTATEEDPEVIRNPAFDLMKNFLLPLFPITTMMQLWDELRKSKEYVDPEREGVCRWVYENIDFLMEFVPEGYSRKIVVATYEELAVAGFVMSSMTLCFVIVSFILLYRWRDERDIKFAQVDALLMTTVGYLFLAIAGISLAVEPSNFACTLGQWCIRLGYTLSMVPILVKLSAINKLNRAGYQFRRADIDSKRFKKIMSVVITVLICYLILWTMIDRSKLEKEFLSKDVDGVRVVSMHNGCSAGSNWWEIMAFAFEALLLLATTILTYQSSDVIDELNESRPLAFMVYSHFLFLLMRLLVFMFMLLQMIPNAMFLKLWSLIVSLDTLLAIIIYFGPKFLKVLYPTINTSRGIHMRSTSIRRGSAVEFGQQGSSSRFRNIHGVRIPDEGVPNLIVRRPTIASNNSSVISANGLIGLQKDDAGKSVSFTQELPKIEASNSKEDSEKVADNKITKTESMTKSSTNASLKSSSRDDQNLIDSLNDDIKSLLKNDEIDESTVSKLKRVRDKTLVFEKLLRKIHKNTSDERIRGEIDEAIEKEKTPLIQKDDEEGKDDEPKPDEVVQAQLISELSSSVKLSNISSSQNTA